MNLADTSESYLMQFPHPPRPDTGKSDQRLERFGQIALGGFALVIFTGILALIYFIVTKMILGGDFWKGTLLASFVFFAGLSLAYVFLRESTKGRKQPADQERAGTELTGSYAPPQIDQRHFDPAASAVEDTTDLLPIETKTRKLT